MTRDEIRAAYLACIEPRIVSAETNADDPVFDKLREVCLVKVYGYELFHPVSDGFGSSDMEFDALVNLYHECRYCWDDDGSLSFTHVVTNHEGCDFDDVFVMGGDRHELRRMDVENFALRHCGDRRLASYQATIFRESTLAWIHTMIPEFKEVVELGKGTDCEKYFEERDRVLKKMIEHIRNDQYCSVKVVVD